MSGLRPRALDAIVLRAPLPRPVEAPMGRMTHRSALLVRIEDRDGAVGWGEAWCNFPAVGADHRAALLRTAIAPLLLGREFENPEAAFEHLTRATHLPALQAAEPGPFAQAIAGVDIALWDLWARRQGLPLWRLLGGASPRIPAYASGIGPGEIEPTIARAQAEGYRAFKLRPWGWQPGHVAAIAAARAQIGPEARLMIDPNQSWTVDQALEAVGALAGLGLDWIEEPIPADAPEADWLALARRAPITLAGGENLRGADFVRALDLGALGVIQPDMAKWGGFSRCVELGKRIRARSRRFCPHYYGGGVGLLASAHLLAAVGGDGMLEVDVADNPLRRRLIALPALVEGGWALSDAPGLGATPDPAVLREFGRALESGPAPV
ncbi:MAG: mandelate racemase/muconate lactonizing enzyme family protein [Alphaproteobacteria bacterium]|nr:mandelate racemase/muconate lactonizing enzyme family protein [Alphaproteobacteria bacterium]